MIQEKREHARTPIRVPVTVHTAQGDVAGETQDLSVGGLFVVGVDALPFGATLSVTLDLPGLGPTRLPAIARWSRTEGVGLQFGLMGPRETHALSELLSPRVKS